MAATVIGAGPIKWSVKQDKDGNRDYSVTWLVQTDDPKDGPLTAGSASGLGAYGDTWAIGNDSDDNATMKLDASATPVNQKETCTLWEVELHYSTKGDEKRCKDQKIEDPLLIPPEISGSFVRYSQEATYDRFKLPITNSAWEQIRGHQIEFDANRPKIKVKMNVPTLDLGLLASMVNTVNAFPLWGLPPRTIMLANAPWEKKFYGQCYLYFSLELEFDIRFETFDKDILDEGTKVLNGKWGTLDGSGFEVNITTGAGGAITGAALLTPNQGGARYPPLSPLLTLAVGGGQGGTITVTTDAKGAVATITGISNAGVGYKDGTASTQRSATNQEIGWQLTSVFGNPPSYLNPQHFIRFKDRNGENAKVVLNGRGLPANMVLNLAPGGKAFFVSIQGGNLNHQLADTAWWLQIVGSIVSAPPGQVPTPDQIPIWGSPNTDFAKGQLVQDSVGNGIYIAMVSSPELEPSDPDAATEWLLVGRNPPGLTNSGPWSAAITYGLGAVVQNVDATGPAGHIHVEVYNGSDFLQLGIPVNPMI